MTQWRFSLSRARLVRTVEAHDFTYVLVPVRYKYWYCDCTLRAVATYQPLPVQERIANLLITFYEESRDSLLLLANSRIIRRRDIQILPKRLGDRHSRFRYYSRRSRDLLYSNVTTDCTGREKITALQSN